ncbi:MAG TPA: GNAT family N-acetyltransferase, partial [Propionibacteriaceae bacterium]
MADQVIEKRPTLDAATVAAVQRLVDDVAAHDEIAPLNEAALLALHHDTVAHYVARSETGIGGYAQQDPLVGTAQLCVHPDARRAGIGTALCEALLIDAPGTELWAFG